MSTIVEFAEALAVILISAVKHTLGGIPAGYIAGFDYLEVVLYTLIGGVMGIVFFVYSARGAKKLYLRYLEKIDKKPRKFTRMNRLIVRVKREFGLYGLALITPPLISVPVGAIIAATIYKDKRRVMLFLIMGVVFWSFLGAAVGPLVGIIAGK